MKDLQENNDKNLGDAVAIDAFDTEQEKVQAAKAGVRYTSGMWKDFAKLMKTFNANIGPISWDRNEDLAKFTDTWNQAYRELSETGRVAATIQFLRLTHTLKDGEIVNQRNRKSLPPFSKNEKFTVLHPGIMEQYLKHYNSRILNIEGRTLRQGAFANNESFESIVKDLC